MAAWMLPAAIIGSALVGSKAASSAASTQADAASKAGDLSKLISDDQIALAREQFNAQALNQEPFRQGGLAAQNQLMKLLLYQTSNMFEQTLLRQCLLQMLKQLFEQGHLLCNYSLQLVLHWR